jgi:AraC-like DNA-binding protein
MEVYVRHSLDVRAVPGRSAKVLIDKAVRLGIDLAMVLRGTGIDPAQLGEPGARISYRQHIGLHRNLVRLRLPPDFGFADEAFSIASYGMLGYAMMSAATFSRSIEIAMKYYHTAGPLCSVSLESGPRVSAIVAEDSFELGDDVLRLVVEEMYSTFPPLLNLLLGHEAQPERVELTYPRPRNVRIYERTFRCPIEFGCAANRYVIDNSLMDQSLVQADADSALLFEQSCRELLEQIEGRDTLANQVRHLLLAAPGKMLSADEAATRFGIGARTLRRRLADEGATYQELLDEVRCRIAIDYLSSTTLSTQDIAELLGFSEATNFRRAFLRWTQRTPLSYRRQARGY